MAGLIRPLGVPEASPLTILAEADVRHSAHVALSRVHVRLYDAVERHRERRRLGQADELHDSGRGRVAPLEVAGHRPGERDARAGWNGGSTGRPCCLPPGSRA
eukprot:3973867-Pyramimonas_sp.AAC.1